MYKTQKIILISVLFLLMGDKRGMKQRGGLVWLAIRIQRLSEFTENLINCIRICVHGDPTNITSLRNDGYYIIQAMRSLSKERPWYSGSMLDCWSTSRAIDPAPGA